MKSSGNPSKAGRKTDDVLGGGGFPIGQWMHSLSDAPRRCIEFGFVYIGDWNVLEMRETVTDPSGRGRVYKK